MPQFDAYEDLVGKWRLAPARRRWPYCGDVRRVIRLSLACPQSG